MNMLLIDRGRAACFPKTQNVLDNHANKSNIPVFIVLILKRGSPEFQISFNEVNYLFINYPFPGLDGEVSQTVTFIIHFK